MPDSTHATTDDRALTRRRLLRQFAASGAAAAAASLVPGVLSAAPVEVASLGLPPIDTPQDALRELAAGNARFVDGRQVGPRRTLARVREVAPKQSPFAAVLSCADSRVPVEIVFDQGFGDLFVCRAAGNIVTPELLGSLEFGTAVLGAKALVVVGHTGCGAVKAAVEGGAAPGQISTLYQHILPAIDRVVAIDGPDLDGVARANVRLQAGLIARSSPLIADMVRTKKLAVVGAMYDLATGRVAVLDA